jgi:hypothetical protein
MGGTWEGIAPLGSQAQPIRMSFSPQKVFITDRNTTQPPSDNPAGEEVLGCRGYMWSAVVRPVGCTAKFSKRTLEVANGRDINIEFSGNSSGGHSCIHYEKCTFPKLETSVTLCCVAYYCPQHKVHLCNDHAVLSASWYATPVRWTEHYWIFCNFSSWIQQFTCLVYILVQFILVVQCNRTY